VSTTLTRAPARSQESIADLRLEPRTRRRRPALAVGSIALVIACVAVFSSLYSRAGDEISVLAISRMVAQGQVLQASDLTVARISANSGIATVPVSDGTAVVGRRAAAPLEPHTLLTVSELVTSFSPPTGDAIVGIAAKEGQLPASGLAPGESVDVIVTGPPGVPASTTGATDPTTGAPVVETNGPGTVLVSHARVLEVVNLASSSGSDNVVVSVLTSRAAAPLVASAAAADQVALVIVAPK